MADTSLTISHLAVIIEYFCAGSGDMFIVTAYHTLQKCTCMIKPGL